MPEPIADPAHAPRAVTPARVAGMTVLAMVAFAANSVLCRLALADGAIDAASFTAIRLATGAGVLGLLVQVRGLRWRGAGSWISALALLTYAAAFSLAYVRLTTATGALLLFGAVQATMVGQGLRRGERLGPLQWLGFGLALAGLVGLLLPGLAAPPLGSAAAMLAAGVAWGVYSLRGRGSGDPTANTAGNFVRALPLAVPVLLLAYRAAAPAITPTGAALAAASGALASGIGYAIWYAAVPALRATTAATVQLSVPLLAALGGVVFLAEPLTPRLLLAAMAVLGGIGLVVLRPRPSGQAEAQRLAPRDP